MSGLPGLARRVARKLRLTKPVGQVDVMNGRVIRGWAVNPDSAEIPARVAVILDGAVMAEKTANVERPDVAQAGLGPVKCGFEISVPLAINDGRAHRMEIRRGVTGPILGGGLFEIPAGTTTLVDVEGLAQFDGRVAAIRGWAAGADRVLLSFDDGPAVEVPLLDEVPGFGPGGAMGFAYRVPRELRDGKPHTAHVSAGGTTLDGAPVSFTISAGRPVVDVLRVADDAILFEAHRDGRPLEAAELRASVDGTPVMLSGSATGLRLDIPPRAKAIVIAAEDGTPLARFEISADGPVEHSTDGAIDSLTPDVLSRARDAFAAFAAKPDERFDPLWYAWAQPDLDPGATAAEALTHYAQTGARAGAAPNGDFDEQGARAYTPAIAQAIAAGDLPCAFALDLIGLETALPPAKAETATTKTPAPPIHADLPQPTNALPSDTSIYSAWTRRLAVDSDTLGTLMADEERMRADIQARPLPGPLPLVSIIMPSWNRAFTIGEAIQSALDQSYPNWELIVSDDASEDRTAEVVRAFSDPRIRYMKFLKSNGAGARNKGLAHARGEIIAYLDSDNIWHPQFLDMMVRELVHNPGTDIAYAAYLDTEIVGAKVELREISRPSFRPIRLSSKNFMDLNTIVHHRRVYDWMGGFDGVLPRLQDWDLALRYTSIFRPRAVDRIGVFYRRNVAWGQVTHLHHGSGAQDVVGEKTRRRLTEAHETLAIRWPETPQVTVLGGPAPGADLLAEGLAERLRAFAEVDVLRGTGPDAVPADLWDAPHAFGTALAPLLSGRTVIDATRDRADWLQAIPGVDPDRTLSLTMAAGRCALTALTPTGRKQDLGAIPLPLEIERKGDGPILVITPRKHAKMTSELATHAASAKRDLLVCGDDGMWYVLSGDTRTDLSLEDALARLSGPAILAAMRPVSEMTPMQLSITAACQAAGVPLAVPSDLAPLDEAGLGSEWVAARGAYHIARVQPAWMLDKLGKLLRDDAAIDRFAERGQLVHAITLHPDLLRERLAAMVHALNVAEDRP